MLQLELQRWREAAHVRADGAQDHTARCWRALGHVRGDHHLGASMLDLEHLMRETSCTACLVKTKLRALLLNKAL